MKSELNLIPTVIINPSTIVVYNQVIWDPVKPSRNKIDTIETEKEVVNENFVKSTRKAEGKVSKHAKRKISKAIEYLVATAYEQKQIERLSQKFVKFRVVFVTLTLPSKQIHTDNEIINRCLNSFLLEIKKYHNVSKYVWRAEKQKNGNIHFHILTDKFISYYEIRNRWNRIVNKLGYVDRFQEKHGHRTPNSTDIHSTRKVKNLKSYLTKYMTKNEEEKQEIQQQAYDSYQENEDKTDTYNSQTGRIWGCSHNLSKIKGFTSEIDSEISDELKKVVNQKEVKKYESTYFTVYNIDYHTLRKYGADQLFGYFCNYLLEEFDYSEQLTI